MDEGIEIKEISQKSEWWLKKIEIIRGLENKQYYERFVSTILILFIYVFMLYFFILQIFSIPKDFACTVK